MNHRSATSITSNILRRLAGFVLPALAPVLLASAPSFACYCYHPGPEAECPWGRTELLAFAGTVLSVENPPFEGAYDKRNDNGVEFAHYRFHLDELYLGDIKTSEIDVYSGRGGGDCSYHFTPGQRYLVIPYIGDSGEIYASSCSETRLYNSDDPLLETLREVRDRRPIASIAGTVLKIPNRYAVASSASSLSGVKVHMVSWESWTPHVTVTTDSRGNFRIYDLAPAKYDIAFDLPSDLKLDDEFGVTSGLTFSANACITLPLTALPSPKPRRRLSRPKKR